MGASAMLGQPFKCRFFFPLAFLLAAAVLTLYSISLGHNFLFDEENIILRNPYIKNFSQIPELFRHGFFYVDETVKSPVLMYYRPLTSFSFMVDFWVWKGNPLGYNLSSVLSHALVCVLLFKFFLVVLRDTKASFLASLVFAVHAVHTDAINHVSGRGTILAAVFILATFILYLDKRFFFAWFCYAAAILSKESALLVPVYLLFLDACFVRRKPVELFYKLIPFLAIAVVTWVCRMQLFPQPLEPSSAVSTAWLRIGSAGPVIGRYLSALFLPRSAEFFGSIRFAENYSDPMFTTTFFVASAIGCLWLLGLARPGTAFFAYNLFFLSLVPFLQLIHFYPEWAEHYLYVPAMAFVMGIGCVLRRSAAVGNVLFRVFSAFLCLVFVSFLGIRTMERNLLYREITRYYEALSESDSPYSVYGYFELARMQLADHHPDQAIRYLKKAVPSGTNLAHTYTLLGKSYEMKDDLDTALDYYLKAARVASQPSLQRIEAAIVMMRLGRAGEAVKILEDAAKDNPRHYPVYRLLMNAVELTGRPEEAMRWYREGLAATQGREPQSAVMRFSALRLLYRKGARPAFNAQLEYILKKDADVSWYGDVARLLAGKLDPVRFEALVKTKYAGFEAEASEYLLMNYVLNKGRDDLLVFLQTNLKMFEKRTVKNPLFRFELEKAQKHLETDFV